MGTKNYYQFMIFELPMYDILHVPNFKPVAHEVQLLPFGANLEVTGCKRNRIDAADNLIFIVRYAFDLNLMKIFCSIWRSEKASRASRLLNIHLQKDSKVAVKS